MIKVDKIAGQNMVLYTGSQNVIDEEIISILDWYTSEYGFDSLYNLLINYGYNTFKKTE